jgi:eukaryotic-like serine/threonine-protein kinase
VSVWRRSLPDMDDTEKPPPPVPEETYSSPEPDTTVLPTGAPPASLAALLEGGWPLPAVERQRFLVDGVVAQGGHGRILRASDRQLERTVALKELLVPGSSAEARFLNEARVTARLQHPSIVPVYEAGRWPGGEPFYTMKLVSGRSLARLIDAASHFRERLELLPRVLDVAEAVAYAHSRRVIHRDLKPSNLLVGEFGETVVIDWGLAKELDRSPPREPTPVPRAVQPRAEELPWLTEADGPAEPVSPPGPEDTEAGTVLGTPAYMPLEQASGQPVDERADVYALGAILYHVLAGRPPYSGSSSQEVLGLVLSRPPPPLEQAQPGVPRELLGIVSRAMAREPARRYPSARELAEDLRRFQAGQLVGAHQYSPWELLARFVRQQAVALSMAVVALLALATGLGLNYVSVLRERDRAERKQAEAEHAWHQATERADMLTLLQTRAALEHSPERALGWLEGLSPSFSAWGQARTLAADALARGLATRLQGHSAALNCVAFSPNGRWLLTTSDDRTVRLWELASG